MLIANKIHFKPKSVTKDRHWILIKGLIQQENNNYKQAKSPKIQMQTMRIERRNRQLNNNIGDSKGPLSAMAGASR